MVILEAALCGAVGFLINYIVLNSNLVALVHNITEHHRLYSVNEIIDKQANETLLATMKDCMKIA